MLLAEFRVLRVLFDTGPRVMVTLAMEQGMTAPGMTMVIDRLEEAGLVRRVRSDADRRAVNVAITGKGGERYKRAAKIHDRFVERAVNGMSMQEVDSFLTTLNLRVEDPPEITAESVERLFRNSQPIPRPWSPSAAIGSRSCIWMLFSPT